MMRSAAAIRAGSVAGLFAVLFLLWPAGAKAAGEAGAVLMQEPFGARPFAMGQAYAGIGDDIFGMAYNPAILTRLKESQAASQFTQSLLNTQLGYLGLASPLSPTQALGLSVSYLDAGKAELFDVNGVSTGKISAERDFLVSLGYSHSMDVASGRLHTGATAKLLNSSILQDMTATAYAADLGALYERPWMKGLASIAASAVNLGPGIRYSGGKAGGSSADPLPLASRLALGYAKGLFASDSLTLGLQVDRVFPDDTLFESIGAEYDYHGLCALRLGYRAGQSIGNFTMGIGMHFKGFAVDYGLGLAQTFNSLQQFSLTYRFNVPGIQYGVPYGAGATPQETLIQNVRTDMNDGRYFDADADINRLEAFFPGIPEAARLRAELERESSAMLKNGPASPRYDYLQGLKNYRQRRWGDAVLSLQAAALKELDNREIQKYLDISKSNYREQQKQGELQRQARIGVLFELADQANEEGDTTRALRIIGEILRLGPYQPAEKLKRQIKAEARRSREAFRRPPAMMTPTVKATPQAPHPSAEDAARAEQLYYEAVRNYADNDLDKALANLRQGLKLDPNSRTVRSALENIEKVMSQKQRTAP